MTKGETKIAQILTSAHINYQTEKTFMNLRGGRFRYDFYIPSQNILIEFNGEQHYHYVQHFYKTTQEFKQAQGRDMRKISYALSHNLILYIIPYWDMDKLYTYDDLIKDEYRALNRYKNIDDYEHHLQTT